MQSDLKPFVKCLRMFCFDTWEVCVYGKVLSLLHMCTVREGGFICNGWKQAIEHPLENGGGHCRFINCKLYWLVMNVTSTWVIHLSQPWPLVIARPRVCHVHRGETDQRILVLWTTANSYRGSDVFSPVMSAFQMHELMPDICESIALMLPLIA